MSWTERILLTFPVDLFGTPEDTLAAINALAYIVDPDLGGGSTFTADQQLNGHFYTETQLYTETFDVLQADTSVWESVLAQKAQDKQAPPLDTYVIKKLHDGLLIGDAARAALYPGFL